MVITLGGLPFHYKETVEGRNTYKYFFKCTLVQALRLCTGRTAYRGSRGLTPPFHDHDTRRGEGSGSRLGRSLPPRKNRYPLYRSWVGPMAGLDRCGRSPSPTGIGSPDRPARSQSLYRLSYPAHPPLYRNINIKIYRTIIFIS